LTGVGGVTVDKATDQKLSEQAPAGTLTPARVAESALQQAARHEHALLACLAELEGYDEPAADLIEATSRRAMRHAGRAVGLAKTAIRVNRDPLAEVLFAALLERYERHALRVEQWAVGASLQMLSIAS
jgi:hypothetical protein